MMAFDEWWESDEADMVAESGDQEGLARAAWGAATERLRVEVAALLADRNRLAAARDHHEQQQRLLLYRDMPKLRSERDAAFTAKCDAQARAAELERELAAEKASYAELWQSQQDLATDHRETVAELSALRAACERAMNQWDHDDGRPGEVASEAFYVIRTALLAANAKEPT